MTLCRTIPNCFPPLLLQRYGRSRTERGSFGLPCSPFLTKTARFTPVFRGSLGSLACQQKRASELINAFLSPDKYSRTADHEGRRVAKIDGGWELLNFEKYRLLASTADTLAKNATRQKRFRERNAKVTESNASVTHDNAGVTENTVKAEAEVDSKEEAKVKALKKPLVAAQSDDEWLRGLQTILAYEHLNVAAEYSRAKVWCETNRRQCTRKFFTNWLNRSSANNREIAVTRPAHQSAPTPQIRARNAGTALPPHKLHRARSSRIAADIAMNHLTTYLPDIHRLLPSFRTRRKRYFHRLYWHLAKSRRWFTAKESPLLISMFPRTRKFSRISPR